MKIVSGEIVVAGRLAYVPQQPWIVSASLRDNVLLGSDFDQRRSDFCTSASLRVKKFLWIRLPSVSENLKKILYDPEKYWCNFSFAF